MGLTRAEQETSLVWQADRKLASVGDWKQSTYNALTAAGYQPSHTEILNGEVVGWIWDGIPVSALRITPDGGVRVRQKRQAPKTPTDPQPE